MVIISNGFNKFHLSVAAAEMEKKGLLSLFITGAYPTHFVHKIMMFPILHHIAKSKRLLARKEKIQGEFIRPLWLPEAVHEISLLPKLSKFLFLSERLNLWSFELYRHFAAKTVKSVNQQAKIYHYRGGFGGKSVEVAKSLGMLTVCDYSIAHPTVMSHIVSHHGRMPKHGEIIDIDRFWANILKDSNQADAVLVNSDFVKETFLHEGWNSKRIHVIYCGVDDQFLKYIPVQNKCNKTNSGFLRLMFAGSFERRKGAEILIEGLRKVHNRFWQLKIAGKVDADLKKQYASFFMDDRIQCLGLLSRSELAKCMTNTEIFVFPSLAEGSARVIFEALACGCYIITTPNSGSIVKDNVHGRLVPPGDSDALAEAINKIFAQRKIISNIGYNNSTLIRSKHLQKHYGDALSEFYKRLLQKSEKFDFLPVNN